MFSCYNIESNHRVSIIPRTLLLRGLFYASPTVRLIVKHLSTIVSMLSNVSHQIFRARMLNNVSYKTTTSTTTTKYKLWKSWRITFDLFRHHHHHVVPLARISLTLSPHLSLSFIATGRSSGLHPVSSHSCCMYVRAGCPAFARPYAGVHRSTSLMSSSLLLQQCPACLPRLAWIAFVMGVMRPYSWFLVGCCRQDLFNIARNIRVWLPSSFFSSRLVSVQVVHPYSSIDTTAAWKKLHFILSVPYLKYITLRLWIFCISW